MRVVLSHWLWNFVTTAPGNKHRWRDLKQLKRIPSQSTCGPPLSDMFTKLSLERERGYSGETSQRVQVCTLEDKSCGSQPAPEGVLDVLRGSPSP